MAEPEPEINVEPETHVEPEPTVEPEPNIEPEPSAEPGMFGEPEPNTEPEIFGEPGPSTEPEIFGEPGPEVNDYGPNGHLFGNQTPDAEPQYDFSSTFGIWWDLHCYGLGAIFLLIAIFAVRSTILMLCRKQGRVSNTKPFLLFVNILVVILCLLRALYLFVNPYNVSGFFPVVVNNILFNIPFPCMTTCFAMILWVLREVGQVKLTVQSRSRSLRALFTIAVTHLGLVIIVSAIIELTRNEILLIVMCHGFFVVWEIFLCCSAIVLMYRISKAIRETGKTLVSISTRGRSPARKDNKNDENMNIRKVEESMDENCDKSSSDRTLGNTYDKISNTQLTNPYIRPIDGKPDDLEKLDYKVSKTSSQQQLDPAFLDVGTKEEITKNTNTNGNCDGMTSPASGPGKPIRSTVFGVARNFLSSLSRYGSSRAKMEMNDTKGLSVVSSEYFATSKDGDSIKTTDHRPTSYNCDSKNTMDMKIHQDSGHKLSFNRRQSIKTKQTGPPGQPKHPQRGNSRSAHSTSTDMGKRARLTRKVTRITVVTTLTSCIAAILNLLFVLSVFPGTHILKNSEYWLFVFYNCFRVTEIAMACVILYFVAQPMPKSRTQARSTVKK
ncbi:uncharacterized protein LOC129276862 [Lytechinus pictus]|uniref:uncharacterized protein LOC129276862 n=1 Tax=Lytechinus pictus TaxID=7653 RepID=UPI0030B9D2B4